MFAYIRSAAAPPVTYAYPQQYYTAPPMYLSAPEPEQYVLAAPDGENPIPDPSSSAVLFLAKCLGSLPLPV
jgi:hypothetical protein